MAGIYISRIKPAPCLCFSCSVAANLNECAGTTWSSWSPVSTNVAGYATVLHCEAESILSGTQIPLVFTAAIVNGPCPPDGEFVEAKHVKHTDRWKGQFYKYRAFALIRHR